MLAFSSQYYGTDSNYKSNEWKFNVLSHVSLRGVVLLVLLQMCGLVRKNIKRKIMFIGLLILSLLVFIYLMYVLIKPEKF